MEFQLNLFIEDMPKKRREYDHFPTNKHRQHLARLRGLEVSAVTGEPDAFTIDRECELKSTDEMKSVVRYTRHTLDIEEVKQHIVGGKVPTRTAMTWNGRVSFVLTDTLHLKKLQMLDVALDDYDHDESGFDADVAIATGEMLGLIPDALGGELEIAA